MAAKPPIETPTTARFSRPRAEIAAVLTAEGVPCGILLMRKAAYRWPVFHNHDIFGGTWPVRDAGLTAMDYRAVNCPVTESILADCMKLPINEAMSNAYIEKVAHAIRTVLKRFEM